MIPEELDTAINAIGMNEYIGNIFAQVNNGLFDKLRNTSAVKTAIETGWQGVSKERFLNQLEDAIDKIITDILYEEDNLQNRLLELENQYYETDKNMIAED